jgi:hypothetical protein
MTSARFEPATPAIEWPKTFALDRKTTGISSFFLIALLEQLLIL